jgi:hypothetical protein
MKHCAVSLHVLLDTLVTNISSFYLQMLPQFSYLCFSLYFAGGIQWKIVRASTHAGSEVTSRGC